MLLPGTLAFLFHFSFGEYTQIYNPLHILRTYLHLISLVVNAYVSILHRNSLLPLLLKFRLFTQQFVSFFFFVCVCVYAGIYLISLALLLPSYTRQLNIIITFFSRQFFVRLKIWLKNEIWCCSILILIKFFHFLHFIIRPYQQHENRLTRIISYITQTKNNINLPLVQTIFNPLRSHIERRELMSNFQLVNFVG